jgi:hypothetical protein
MDQTERPRKKPEINSLDITNDEKQKEKPRIQQFFSSLLEVPPDRVFWHTSGAFGHASSKNLPRALCATD